MPHPDLYPRAPSRSDPYLQHPWTPVRAYTWRPFFLEDVQTHTNVAGLYFAAAILLIYFGFSKK